MIRKPSILSLCLVSIVGFANISAAYDLGLYRKIEATHEPSLAGEQLERQAIQHQKDAFTNAYINADLESQLEVYAQQATLSPPNHAFLNGILEIREYWSSQQEHHLLSRKLNSHQLNIDGNFAIDHGTYEQKTETVGKISRQAGKYMIVWEKDADGQWRIAREMWTADGKASDKETVAHVETLPDPATQDS